MLRFVCKQIIRPLVIQGTRRQFSTSVVHRQQLYEKRHDGSYFRAVENVKISSVFTGNNDSVKIFFSDNQSAEFKFIWLRDNCKCTSCVHPETHQKLLDTPQLDMTTTRPKSVQVNDKNQLVVTWDEGGRVHRSVFQPDWLFKYGQCFMEEKFANADKEAQVSRPPLELWDRAAIWKSFPEISFREFQHSDEGLKAWLDMFHRYGVALIRGVPTEKGKIIDVVRRFAYVKETSYGVTFDVVAEPNPEAHLAFTGSYLHHHTDMNYREKSPGMQLLHCLKANDLSQGDPGGMSFFVDGFAAARWLREQEATAFHLLSAVPVRFQIKTSGRRFSQLWPIICLDSASEISEIHYNNRTMGPLQVPSHLVVPFYHAYKIFTDKIRSPSMQLSFHLQPGDVVAFNNRRILHGRTGFNPALVSRYLEGCYVDIDEALSVYDSLLMQK